MKVKKPARINELDAKILRILLKDGRTGFDDLAKACKVTKNVAWKRCKAMEKTGIIKGATVLINYGHFGLGAIATLLISVKAEQIDRVMETIQQIGELNAFRQYNSVYNVRVYAWLRDLNELDQVKQLIKQRIPIMGLKTYVWAGVRNIPENLNLTGILKHDDEQIEINPTHCSTNDEMSIDDLDKQIMEKLTVNGRASFTQIAKQIGVSTETVIKRYHNLKERGSIKVSIQINPNKIEQYACRYNS